MAPTMNSVMKAKQGLVLSGKFYTSPTNGMNSTALNGAYISYTEGGMMSLP